MGAEMPLTRARDVGLGGLVAGRSFKAAASALPSVSVNTSCEHLTAGYEGSGASGHVVVVHSSCVDRDGRHYVRSWPRRKLERRATLGTDVATVQSRIHDTRKKRVKCM
ncbi:hypothetical protein M8818_006875 [Zalaria obscura]|uniref:Uncharacterized protein n=1 Tax=Zalaria obscura TaxID=2024903 RepID=A0ACC3S5S9_9PEZI